MSNETVEFGKGTATFDAAGGLEGVKSLVDEFYRVMDTHQKAKKVRDMHPDNLDVTNDKLYCFLVGWMGGPQLFNEKYKPMSVPGMHMHLKIDADDRDMWMFCMQQALDVQPYTNELKNYLYQQFLFPAELIRKTCERNL